MVEIKLKKVEIPPKGIHLLIETYINSTPANLVVDTGASRSVIDYDFLMSLNPPIDLKEEEGESAGVGSSNLHSFVTRIDKFVIGELTLQNVELASLDLTHVKQSYENLGETPIYGVLGGDILNEYHSTIDYKKSVLRLND